MRTSKCNSEAPAWKQFGDIFPLVNFTRETDNDLRFPIFNSQCGQQRTFFSFFFSFLSDLFCSFTPNFPSSPPPPQFVADYAVFEGQIRVQKTIVVPRARTVKELVDFLGAKPVYQWPILFTFQLPSVRSLFSWPWFIIPSDRLATKPNTLSCWGWGLNLGHLSQRSERNLSTSTPSVVKPVESVAMSYAFVIHLDVMTSKTLRTKFKSCRTKNVS